MRLELSAGAFVSATEHGVFEKIYGSESVSTEKLLALANQQGIAIYTINRDNINQTLPLISAPANVKQSISDSVVNSGWIAVIPQRGLQVNNWFGYGWQVLDPNSGAAGYMLAGYLTSGSVTTNAGGNGSKPIEEKDFPKTALKIKDLCAILGLLTIGVFLALAPWVNVLFGSLAADMALVAIFANLPLIGAVLVSVIGALTILFALGALYVLYFAYEDNCRRRRRYAFSSRLSIVT